MWSMFLKRYTDNTCMTNTNKETKKWKANDTFCREISIKMKINEELKRINWDGKKVLSVSIENVDYMLALERKEQCYFWENI